MTPARRAMSQSPTTCAASAHARSCSHAGAARTSPPPPLLSPSSSGVALSRRPAACSACSLPAGPGSSRVTCMQGARAHGRSHASIALAGSQALGTKRLLPSAAAALACACASCDARMQRGVTHPGEGPGPQLSRDGRRGRGATRPCQGPRAACLAAAAAGERRLRAKGLLLLLLRLLRLLLLPLGHARLAAADQQRWLLGRKRQMRGLRRAGEAGRWRAHQAAPCHSHTGLAATLGRRWGAWLPWRAVVERERRALGTLRATRGRGPRQPTNRGHAALKSRQRDIPAA